MTVATVITTHIYVQHRAAAGQALSGVSNPQLLWRQSQYSEMMMVMPACSGLSTSFLLASRR